MIERYLDYLSAIRRYSPRTIEIYRGVLEDFCIYLLQSGSVPPDFASLIPPTASQRVPPIYEAMGGHGLAGQTPTAIGEADTATASGNRSHPRLRKREGPASEGSGRGPAPPDVFRGSSPLPEARNEGQ